MPAVPWLKLGAVQSTGSSIIGQASPVAGGFATSSSRSPTARAASSAPGWRPCSAARSSASAIPRCRARRRRSRWCLRGRTRRRTGSTRSNRARRLDARRASSTTSIAALRRARCRSSPPARNTSLEHEGETARAAIETDALIVLRHSRVDDAVRSRHRPIEELPLAGGCARARGRRGRRRPRRDRARDRWRRSRPVSRPHLP